MYSMFTGLWKGLFDLLTFLLLKIIAHFSLIVSTILVWFRSNEVCYPETHFVKKILRYVSLVFRTKAKYLICKWGTFLNGLVHRAEISSPLKHYKHITYTKSGNNLFNDASYLPFQTSSCGFESFRRGLGDGGFRHHWSTGSIRFCGAIGAWAVSSFIILTPTGSSTPTPSTSPIWRHSWLSKDQTSR